MARLRLETSNFKSGLICTILWLKLMRNFKQICSFLIVDKVVCLAIRLHATSSIQPTSSIDDRQRLNAMMNAVCISIRTNALVIETSLL